MRLLESQGAGERRPGGTAISLVAHAAVIAAAVIGTARAEVTARIIDVPKEIIYRAPLPEQPRRSAPSPSRPSGPTEATPQPTPVVPVVPVPTVVPTSIPQVTVDVAARPLADLVEVVFGGRAAADAAEEARGSAATGGPDAGGTWDAHAVEVPVRADPRNPAPAYPEMLRVAGVGGRVLAEFVVDTTGRVRPGSFVAVSTTHDLFTMSVCRTVASLRFTPALVQGRRVPQRVRVPFEFAITK